VSAASGLHAFGGRSLWPGQKQSPKLYPLTAAALPRHNQCARTQLPFKVEVGPPQISTHQGQTVLITEESEQINWPSEKGLYFFDTRIVSSWTNGTHTQLRKLFNGHRHATLRSSKD
jgi:hypothetical protein